MSMGFLDYQQNLKAIFKNSGNLDNILKDLTNGDQEEQKQPVKA